ncbi:uncharacterized protein SCODWIG_02269 [Saccharomycodes ludwigii]|uniref:Protein Ste5 Fus3-binding domain-containing protein n=1 Tax=Saccharomycodes ludwigii TaxID=36035 RepID=A0A376B763_9ASCO|nr:hypothetical protein SCDLUD_001681 [Saccharomycodes ludwigii]KAH3901897.1 hypothetical protein SCDLUD_001681 [Saccharomycodes ludwigii]SSD60508.1 uncharacterized protein SCODWIG_02269 [Saccharomycodes ludwigii]
MEFDSTTSFTKNSLPLSSTNSFLNNEKKWVSKNFKFTKTHKDTYTVTYKKFAAANPPSMSKTISKVEPIHSFPIRLIPNPNPVNKLFLSPSKENFNVKPPFSTIKSPLLKNYDPKILDNITAHNSNVNSNNENFLSSSFIQQNIPSKNNNSNNNLSQKNKHDTLLECFTPSEIPSSVNPPNLKKINNTDENYNGNLPVKKKNSKKKLLNEKCCLCTETVMNKICNEKIITLECDHVVHEECLYLFMEMKNAENTNNDINPDKLFPECLLCCQTCVPLDGLLKDSIIFSFLMKDKMNTKQPTSPKTDNPPENYPAQQNMPLTHIPNKDNHRICRPEIAKVLSPASSIRDHNKHCNSIKNGGSIKNKPVSKIFHKNTHSTDIIPSVVTSSVSKNIPDTLSYNHEGSDADEDEFEDLQINRTTLTSNNKANRNNSITTLNQEKEPKVLISLAFLRSYFIQQLLANFKDELEAWIIDLHYGLLRIVDILNFSEDGKTYNKCYCYLFENILLIAYLKENYHAEDRSKMFSSFKLIELKQNALCKENTAIGNRSIDSMKVKNLRYKIVIDTLESSVLKSKILVPLDSSSRITQTHTFYMTQNLNNNDSKIIEKWISALLDFNLFFDNCSFTSTLKIPNDYKFDNNKNNSVRTEIKESASNKNSVGISTFDIAITDNKPFIANNIKSTADVIVRRRESVFSNGIHSNSNNNRVISKLPPVEKEALDSASNFEETEINTIITFYLTLKKREPTELIIVLQLDSEKKITQIQNNNLINAIKALNTYPKLKKLHLCCISEDLKILCFGSTTHVLSQMSSGLNFKQFRGATFTPEDLFYKIYPHGASNDFLNDVGLVVISNSSMNESKSCLFMNYNIFGSNPTQFENFSGIKIHVGFLNVDYSNKISELLEIDTWNDLLEVISFTFNIKFGEDSEEVVDTHMHLQSPEKSFHNVIIDNYSNNGDQAVKTDVLTNNLGHNSLENSLYVYGGGNSPRWTLLINEVSKALDESINFQTDIKTVHKQNPEIMYEYL